MVFVVVGGGGGGCWLVGCFTLLLFVISSAELPKNNVFREL